MHFPVLSLLLPTLALSSAIPSPHSPRALIPTGQTVKQDVINIHNAVLGLDASVQSSTGATLPTSLIEGVPVLLGVADIHVVNRAGYVHALAAQPFNVKDSSDVIDTVVSTVDVSIPAATQNLKAKAALFKQSGFTPVVIASLSLLLNDHDTFSQVVLEKIDPGVGVQKSEEGRAAVQNIHDAIQDAIDFYEAGAF